MQRIAQWLTARLVHAVAATIAMFPLGLPALGGAICVLVQLRSGFRQAAMVALLAVASVTALSAGVGFTPAVVATLAPDTANTTIGVLIYASVLLGLGVGIGYLLVRTASVTLAAQLMLVTTIVAFVLVDALGPEARVLWRTFLETLRENMVRNDFGIDEEMLIARVAPLMTACAAGVTWLTAMLAMFVGYAMFRILPGESAVYGRFRELNLGRVLAGMTVLVSLLATLSDSSIPVGIAFVLILAFILQGLALCHWIVDRLGLSTLLLLVLYLAIVITLQSGILLLLLSVLGYVDAWFDLRRRFSVPTA